MRNRHLTRKRVIEGLLLGLVISAGTHASPEARPATLTLDDRQLELRSTGSAYYARFIHVYDAALYAPADTRPEQLLDSATAKCLALSYRVSLKGSDIRKAAEKVLSRQHADLAPWEADLARLHAAYRDVGDGDEYALCHHPRTGTELSLNGVPLTRIETPGFDALYFGIWLREDAISRSLRDDLVRLD